MSGKESAIECVSKPNLFIITVGVTKPTCSNLAMNVRSRLMTCLKNSTRVESGLKYENLEELSGNKSFNLFVFHDGVEVERTETLSNEPCLLSSL